mgnify:CR=1 FL=1
MFKKEQDIREDLALDEAIRTLLESMDQDDPGSDTYSQKVQNLDTLYKAKAVYGKRHVSADAVLTAAASIVGVVLMLGFEKSNVITTKALSFLPKLHL